MFRNLLQILEQRTADKLKEKGGALYLWVNEWAKLYLGAFEPDARVVYTSSYAFPMEILHAYDVVPFDFEIASGMIGSSGDVVPTMMTAEEQGYSLDICSFHRTSLGAFYKEYFPKPDLLITTSHYCDGKMKTNEILSILHQKPSEFLYVPSEISKASVGYVEKQLHQIAHAIGETVGQRFDLDRLKESVRSSNRARRMHMQMLDLLKHRPAPWGGYHLVSYSINGLLFTGSKVKERLNQAFIQEMKQRIEAQGLRPERHRLYWFAWIPTYPSNIFDILKENQVSVPLCETIRMYWDEIDEENPFEGLALRCLKDPFVGPGTRRLDGLAELKEEYHFDGAMLFATPACRHAKSAYRIIRDRLASMDIPLLMLDMDICDPRGYSPEQTKTRLESYIELLGQRN